MVASTLMVVDGKTVGKNAGLIYAIVGTEYESSTRHSQNQNCAQVPKIRRKRRGSSVPAHFIFEHSKSDDKYSDLRSPTQSYTSEMFLHDPYSEQHKTTDRCEREAIGRVKEISGMFV